ncbi:hypothetical protein G6716_04890 [Polynucleobacter paneuropaeus]|nr:hypothetical protein G6716_04890 [Polynucleobacter paneuropaeus]
MRYEYKTVSLLHYIGKGPGKGAGFGAADALGNIWDQSKKIADVVEHCLNHYAQDGWQFMRLVEISSENLSSVGGMLAKGAMTAVFGKKNEEQNNAMYPLVFFRREVDSTEVKYDQGARASVNFDRQLNQEKITKLNNEVLPEQHKPLSEDHFSDETTVEGVKINNDGTWTCPKLGHQNPLPIGKCNYCSFSIKNEEPQLAQSVQKMPLDNIVEHQQVAQSVQAISPDNDEIAKYGITFNGEKYCYKDYKYDKVQDAISYAKKNH